MTEVWKEIPGFPGYEVSDLGRVRCWRPLGAGSPPDAPRTLKAKGRGTDTYLRVELGRKGGSRTVHRLVAEAFVPGQQPGLVAAHDNGDKYDNRASNIVWKTYAENQADKLRHGTHGRKLTIDDVREIRRIYAEGGRSLKEVGLMFGVNASTAHKVVRRIYWREVA